MICIMLGAILLGTLPYMAVAESEADVIEDNRIDREMLANALPPELVRENVENFDLQILCDISASETIAAASGFSNALSEKAMKRNEHLSVETGAQIVVTMAVDFTQMAKEDILSGELHYNLYAADASGSLSPLLSAGYLADVSDSVHIRSEKAWFDGNIMDELELYGGRYLSSSEAADARSSAAVVVYNRSIESRTDALHTDGQSLASLALDGQFTLEALLAASRAVCGEPAAEDTLFDAMSTEASFYGFCYGDEDIFPLYFGAGGSFVSTEADSPSVVPLATLRNSLQAVKQLTGDPSVTANTYAFAEGAALFSVCRVSEIASLRETVKDVGILPLPKENTADDYHSYIDLANTTMMAIPKGVASQQKVEYLISRMAFLSYGYIEPLLKEQIGIDTPDDERILSIVTASAACDLSTLFGYGDINGLIVTTFHEGDGRLALNYYNRKTLYEKAFSIIEKRLGVEQE